MKVGPPSRWPCRRSELPSEGHAAVTDPCGGISSVAVPGALSDVISGVMRTHQELPLEGMFQRGVGPGLSL